MGCWGSAWGQLPVTSLHSRAGLPVPGWANSGIRGSGDWGIWGSGMRRSGDQRVRGSGDQGSGDLGNRGTGVRGTEIRDQGNRETGEQEIRDQGIRDPPPCPAAVLWGCLSQCVTQAACHTARLSLPPLPAWFRAGGPGVISCRRRRWSVALDAGRVPETEVFNFTPASIQYNPLKGHCPSGLSAGLTAAH